MTLFEHGVSTGTYSGFRHDDGFSETSLKHIPAATDDFITVRWFDSKIGSLYFENF